MLDVSLSKQAGSFPRVIRDPDVRVVQNRSWPAVAQHRPSSRLRNDANAITLRQRYQHCWQQQAVPVIKRRAGPISRNGVCCNVSPASSNPARGSLLHFCLMSTACPSVEESWGRQEANTRSTLFIRRILQCEMMIRLAIVEKTRAHSSSRNLHIGAPYCTTSRRQS